MFFLIAAHSKWGEIYKMRSTTCTKTIEYRIMYLLHRVGFLDQVASDNGPQFISEEFYRFILSN